jgi:putative DNA primase/helicase
MTETSSDLTVDLSYIANNFISAGWSVMPVEKISKLPSLEWKHLQTEFMGLAEIDMHFKEDVNIGIVTGKISQIIVLDLDPGGDLTGREIPITPTSQTGRGGFHYIFEHPGFEVRNRVGLWPGIDIRGDGGYIVAPPSIHPNGKQYKWIVNPAECRPAPCPQWLLDALNKEDKDNSAGSLIFGGVAKGKRNHTATKIAGKLLYDNPQSQWEEYCWPELCKWNAKCSPPLSKEELKSVWNSIREREISRIQSLANNTNEVLHFTDLGNARRLVKHHGNDLRYCFEFKCWFYWNGKLWVKDESGEVARRAKETIGQIYAEASRIQEDSERTQLAKHAIKSESRSKIESMISLAKSEPSIPIASQDFDSSEWMLNCTNGVLDLKNCQLLRHEPSLYLTKNVSTSFDPDADCPVWDNFLDQVMNHDQQLINFLQRSVGYALTGSTREHVFFILYGTGANGKSTFLSTLSTLLNDYARQTPVSSLLAKKTESISNDLARLRGARFVSAVEVDEGKRLSEAIVKQLTGGDKITARFLHQEFFEFTPRFKTFLATNHKPVIKGTDHAIWRRIRLIPFNVTIADKDQDHGLARKLQDELPGILKWALKGCLDWQKHGLGLPEGVEAATNQYRSEMDVLGSFIDEICVTNDRSKVGATVIYEKYVEWCQANREYAMNRRSFVSNLKERGFIRERSTGGKFCWFGVGLQCD